MCYYGRHYKVQIIAICNRFGIKNVTSVITINGRYYKLRQHVIAFCDMLRYYKGRGHFYNLRSYDKTCPLFKFALVGALLKNATSVVTIFDR